MSMESKKVTILSIDGGGPHGVVPAVLLLQLETYLKEELEKEGEENAEIRLAEYFDVVAGAGMGSLIACMLCKPEPSNMSEIMHALEDISKGAFPDDFQKGVFEQLKGSFVAGVDLATSVITNIIRRAPAPLSQTIDRYWARSWEEQASPIEQFRSKLDECLGNSHLDHTITNLVVPAYHFDSGRPMVFSSHVYSQGEIEDFGESVSLKDVVLGSSATPTVFPFHEMKGKHYNELAGKFADGSIVANNPSMLAMGEAAMIFGSEGRFKNYMVLSLGTVRSHFIEKLFEFDMSKTFDMVVELVTNLTRFTYWTDIVAGCIQHMYIFCNAMTELHMSRLFPSKPYPKFSSNYLRLQVYEKDIEKDAIFKEIKKHGGVPSMLNGSKTAFDKLKQIAEKTLRLTARFVHPETGGRHRQTFTNREALREFARRLHKQKKIKDEINRRMMDTL